MSSIPICSKSQTTTALVLAGGGARGAYEAGVLRFILDELKSAVNPAPAFNLFAGTSIGALNSSFLAATCETPATGAMELAAYWRELTIDRILHFGSREMLRMSGTFLGKSLPFEQWLSNIPRPGAGPHPPVQGIFSAAPLFEEMRKMIPWYRIRRAIDAKTLKGIALCATELCTGKSVIFYQKADTCPFVTGVDTSKEARAVRLRLEHAMASAAIPFIFPAVQIDGVCYTDGSLRQNTPIYPAMRMGADKMMVISLMPPPETTYTKARMGCQRHNRPGMLFLLGRLLDLLMAESLDYELKRIDMFNNLIKSGQSVYGDAFLEKINQVTYAYRQTEYRPIRTCLIRPSADLNDLAIEALKKAPEEIDLPGVPGKVLKKILLSAGIVESGLLSYLLFTPTYIARLLELGFEDARSRKDDILAFFAADP